MILAADIGGTKSHLALADNSGEVIADKRYPSRAFSDLESVLDSFLQDFSISREKVDRLVLALAAPLTGECIDHTNLPWQVCRKALQSRFPQAELHLVNDFQAAALGALAAGEEQLLALHDTPREAGGRKLALGAGTGMGVAYLHREGDHYYPWPTEAGHIAFAPADEQQWRLCRHLQARYGRTSWERILSGPGLADLYHFLDPRKPPREPPAIIDAANEEKDDTAREALTLFARLYGSYCGDMALAWQPSGGIYLLGGVTTHITSWLQQPAFLEAYGAKGRMSALVNRFPIHIVMEPRAGLLGAIQYALQTQVTS
ncbi:MAG: glucokinase [Gammaproteobacteria bacterium]|nr:MAG: glucokinase [Gammaproteobacteria bacterium]RTZ76380.1 MAG: glucokinase [Gammaproteobacteria bacterium]